MLDSGDGVTHAVPVFEGFSMPHAIRRVDVAGRDVTEHLQLLLRKAGYHLHTSAEKEVVRMTKEKVCYVALNPSKEEKDAGGKGEDFKLPDGNTIRVRRAYITQHGLTDSLNAHSSEQNAFERQRSFSTRSSSGRNMLVCIKSWWILSTKRI